VFAFTEITLIWHKSIQKNNQSIIVIISNIVIFEHDILSVISNIAHP